MKKISDLKILKLKNVYRKIENMSENSSTEMTFSIEYKALNLKMVASLLSLSPRSVERQIASGKLKCVKFGGARRILKSDLRDFIKMQREGR